MWSLMNSNVQAFGFADVFYIQLDRPTAEVFGGIYHIPVNIN